MNSALVPDPSPISQSGITFFNSFDENASNHLAIGAAYATSVEGGADMTEEELRKLVLIVLIHVDFMIGSNQMDMGGQDGSRNTNLPKWDWVM